MKQDGPKNPRDMQLRHQSAFLVAYAHVTLWLLEVGGKMTECTHNIRMMHAQCNLIKSFGPPSCHCP